MTKLIIGRLIKIILVFQILIINTIGITAITIEEDMSMEDKKVVHVLLIDGLTPSYLGTQIYIDTITSTMSEYEGMIFDFSYEYLDIKKFVSNPSYDSFVFETLRTKYQTYLPDIIISSSITATRLDNQNLFEDIPVILAWNEVKIEDFPDNYYNVPWKLDFDKNIELIDELFTNAGNIHVITDVMLTDETHNRYVLDLQLIYPELDITIHREMNYEILLETVKNIPFEDVIFYHRWFIDNEGRSYKPETVFDEVQKVAKAPIIVNLEQRLGTGAVGGYITSPTTMGTSAAKAALSILLADNEKIPERIFEVDSQYIFDYRQLIARGIEVSQLPEDSILIHKELNVFEQYKNYIISIALFIVFQTFIIVLLILNIRKKNELQEALSTTNDKIIDLNIKLKKEDEMKDNFLVTVSKELQNPLNGIGNIADNLMTLSIDDYRATRVKEIGYIKYISSRMVALVGDLTDTERIKRNELSFDIQPISIGSIIKRVMDVYMYILADKDIALKLDGQKLQYMVMADTNRLIQVLYHLLDSVEHNMDKGIIYIQIEDMASAVNISVKGLRQKKSSEYRPEYLEWGPSHEFEVFSEQMNLKLSKEIIIKMSGSFNEKKNRNNNSVTYSFTLPYAKEQEEDLENNQLELLPSKQQLEKENKEEYRSINQYHVMVVETDLIHSKEIGSMLNNKLYNITLVYSGIKAQEALTYKHYDAILVSASLKDMSGFELCEQIRRSYTSIQLPIIFIDMLYKQENIQHGYKMGANDYLVRPFIADQLQTKMENLMRLKASAQEAINNETSFLRAQIKPHFLYNAMNTIMSFCYTDSQRAGELIGELRQYLHQSFSFNNDNSIVSVASEVALIKAYTKIEKARFGDRLNLIFQIDEGLLDKAIMPISIQPLVENSIRHGLMKRNAGGTVEIEILFDEDDKEKMRIAVIDNGCGIPESILHVLHQRDNKNTNLMGVGMKNINRRLHQGYNSALTIKSVVGEGTEVSFILPVTAMIERSNDESYNRR